MTRPWWVGAALALIVSCSSNAVADGKAPLSTAEATLAQLAKDLLDQNQPISKRLEVARVLGGWATAQVREPLLAVLKDPSPVLREAAARGLGWPGNREAVPALRTLVETEDVAAVKAAALQALGRIGDASARPLLVAAANDRDAAVREAALWGVALGPLVDSSDRVGHLVQFAEDRAFDGQLRCDAIRTLSTVNEDRVVEALMRILETEPRIPMAVPNPRDQQQIMEMRRLQANDAAGWAADALRQLQAQRAVPLLLRTAEDPSDYFLRVMSLQALIDLEAAEAQPVFLRRLEDQLPDNRILALMGLARLGDRSAVPRVMTRLKDGNGAVRAQAVIALAVLGDVSVRPTLEALQKTEQDSSVQIALEEALGYLPR